MMGRHFSNLIFFLIGVALWLIVGNEVHAGFVSLTVADSLHGISVDLSSSTGAMGDYRRSDEDKGNNPLEQNPNPLIITFASLGQNGETGGRMSTGPNNSSAGTSFVAVVSNDPLCISPHLLSRLVVESASRPPAPFRLGVFRPPRTRS
jgi:hypothetical protein